MRRVTYFLAALLLVCVVSGVAMASDSPTSAPVISIASPTNGATISGDGVTIAVSINPDGRYSVAKLRVFLDGQCITERAFDTPAAPGSSSSFHWKTTRTSNGSHQVDIQAFSETGDYLGMASCRVTVTNVPVDMSAPKASILSPKEGEIVTGIRQIVINATDDSGVDPLVAIFVDDTLRSASNTKPYVYEWDTTKNENGPHIISVTASDDAANESQTKPVKVIVKNPVAQTPVEARSTTETTITAAETSTSSTPVTTSAKNTSVESARNAAETTGSFEVAQTPSKVKAPAASPKAVPVAAPTTSTAVTSGTPKTATVAKPTPKPVSVPVVKAPAAQAASAPVVTVTPAAAPAATKAASKPVTVAKADPVAAPTMAVKPKASSTPSVASTTTEKKSTPVVASTPAKPVKVVVPVAKPDSATKVADAKPTSVKVAKAEPAVERGSAPKSVSTVASKPAATKSVSSTAAPKAQATTAAKKPVRVASVPVLKAQALDSESASSSVSKAGSVAAHDGEYVVQNGDCPSVIAYAYGTDVEALMSLNNIQDPTNLQVGDKIQVPATAKMVRVRTVVEMAGGSLVWNSKTKTVHAVCQQADVKLKIGSKNAVVNAQKVKMDKPARVHAGRTVISKSFVSKELGIDVD